MVHLEDLTKDELLSIIHNQVRGGKVVYLLHPCYCCACGKGHNGDEPVDLAPDLRKRHPGSPHYKEPYLVDPIPYLCDSCEKVL